jgi:hypothetical protein
MTAIGKFLVVSVLFAALGLLTWSTSLYAERPSWFAPVAEGESDRAGRSLSFAQMKAETDALARSAAVASEAWGANRAALEKREKLRVDRRLAYAERIRWAHKGNPDDRVDPDNPKSPGKGFYEPVINPRTGLYEAERDKDGVLHLKKGDAVRGTDGKALPGLDGLLGSIEGDTAAAVDLNRQILEQEAEFDRLSRLVLDTENRAIKMGIIRDSVQAELFFLSTFEVNVYETRATVLRRERQLRDRLRTLGIANP